MTSSLREVLRRPSRFATGIERLTIPTDRFDLRAETVRYLVEGGHTDRPLPFDDLNTRVPTERQIWSPSSNALDNDEICVTNPRFRDVYRALMKYLAREVLGFDFLFETTPNLRFHFPVRLPDRYRSKDGRLLAYHSDTLFAHPFEQINCWLPLGKCYGTNALAICAVGGGSEILDWFCREFDYDYAVYCREGRQRFFEKLYADEAFQRYVVDACHPLETDFGELILFDGRCVHGTIENSTPHTRVSLDFRILPLDDAEAIRRHYEEKGQPLPLEGVENAPIWRGGFYEQASAFEL